MADTISPTPPGPAEAPTQTSSAPAQSPATVEASTNEKKAKKPDDPEKRERNAADAQLRRELKNLAKEKDAGKLRAAAAKMREIRDGGTSSSGQAEAPKGPDAALTTAEPGQLPGWPKPSEIAAQEGLVGHLWGEARRVLPARYARVLEPRLEEGTQLNAEGRLESVSVRVNPVAALARGTAPLAAQLMGKVNAMTPATAAAVAVVGVFGPAFIEHMGELLFSPPSTPAAVGQTAGGAESKSPEAKA